MEDDPVLPGKNAKAKINSPEKDGADEKMLQGEDLPHKMDIEITPSDKLNGDAKLDIGDLKTEYIGMGKEELLKYANDPFWIRLRWILFISFWLLWAGMLVGAIVIIYVAPKCDPPPPKTWWEQGPLTEVEPKVTIDELKALKNRHVKGVIVEWPEDAYLVFNDSHSFVTLLKNAKEQGVEVIVDLELGTSQMWFDQSNANESSYRDYYVWRPGKVDNTGNNTPPNNWLNKQSKSSWILSPQRNAYYYAPEGKPLLNFRNETVIGEFSHVIERFLEKGASGIRLRGAPYILVDDTFTDEVRNLNNPGSLHTDYDFYVHGKTEHVEDLGPLLKKWRDVVKNKTEAGPFMVADKLTKVSSYKVDDSLVVDLPFVSDVFTRPTLNVTKVVQQVQLIFKHENVSWPLWKHNSNVLPKDVLDTITLLLPGSLLVSDNTSIDENLLKIRDSPSVMRGILNITTIADNTAFAFIRVTPGNPGILVGVNPTEKRLTLDFVGMEEFSSLVEEVTVQYFTSHYNETGYSLNLKKNAKNIPISPNSAIVLSYVPKREDD